ncbi:MAG: bifunctional folylpolyglutamate synthase/dihydrofolate synthase [Flavobacteriales bacterium]|nr:bifunctional folylpolyglutamate synthase/dihydrofolate synthase [Flavobacteriales bacterium]
MYQRMGAAAYKTDLKNTLDLCSALGNPEKNFKSIHIAGTNGKGSTSHALAAIFQTHGYKTGLYTSPHLVDFRERIKINGEMIPKEEVIRFTKDHKNLLNRIQPSFFEMTVALAFEYFSKEKVDVAIIETGMGGRLDSTNVVYPLVSVITNIGMDHTEFLGNSVQKIAVEKAGIIKKNVPVVIGETSSDTQEIFLNKALECDSSIFFADNNPKYYNTLIESDLIGGYQQKNLLTVLQTCDVLLETGYEFNTFKIADALQNVKSLTGLRGRWDVLKNSPFTVMDCAHNAAGLKEAMLELGKQTYKELFMVFGMVKEKDLNTILSVLPKNAHYIFCQPSIPRAKNAHELYKEALHAGLRGEVVESVSEAYNKAALIAKSQDAVYIGGSTFVVADFLSGN